METTATPPPTSKTTTTTTTTSGFDETSSSLHSKPSPTLPSDPLLNSVVSRLEKVAAVHSDAEGVDILACHHAPHIARRISRLPPLRRRHRRSWTTDRGLSQVAQAPLLAGDSSRRRRQRRTSDLMMGANTTDDDDDNDNDGEGDDEEDEDMDEGDDELGQKSDDDMVLEEISDKPRSKRELPQLPRRRLKRFESRDYLAGLSEESREATVTQTLAELSSLVVDSLRPSRKDEEGNILKPLLTVKADSLLSDTDAQSMGGTDLAATIVALMHHAPVLRHRHVANALCRASVPQASTIISRLGSNSPNSIAALVRGCIEAIQQEPNAVPRAKESIRALTKLSSREAIRIRSMLEASSCLVDVQLEIALFYDPVLAARIVVEQLSSDVHVDERQSDGIGSTAGGSGGGGGSGGDGLSGEDQVKRKETMPCDKSLRQILSGDVALSSACYSALVREIQPTSKQLPIGRIRIFQSAMLWMITFVDCAEMGPIVDSMREFTLLYKEMNAKVPKCDICYANNILINLLLCCRMASKQGSDVSRWHNLMKAALQTIPPCSKSEVCLGRIAALLQSQEVSGLEELLLDFCSQASASMFALSSVSDGFLKVCKWAVVHGDLETIYKKTLTAPLVSQDPSAAIQLIRGKSINEGTISSILREILTSSELSSQILCHPKICSFLIESIESQATTSEPVIPAVSQLQLEDLARHTPWNTTTDTSPLQSQMILQCSYSLFFLDENPLSPFAFDPRDHPVLEVLRLMKNQIDRKPGIGQLLVRFERVVAKTCPEVLDCVGDLELESQSIFMATNQDTPRREMMVILEQSVEDYLANPQSDPCASKFERSYLLARSRFVSTKVDCTVVRALLTTPHARGPLLSYPMLIRDPLLLLQCPLLVWKARGARRVLLAIMRRVLQASEHLTRQTSQSEDVAEEFLASRNLVVCRCLLCLVAGCTMGTNNNETSVLEAIQCNTLSGMIRFMVARTPGLVAMLIKQGIPDVAVDWLVDYCAESFNDAPSLTLLLSDRSGLTASERLRTADAAIRIVIAHGSKDESAAKRLAYAALSHLVSSFFLVLGPVGVPVNVLVEGEGGADVTQVCRKAMFRMLTALQNVHGSRTGLKNECSMALQKLATLCKNERLQSGTVANRRKVFLKEIWDALVKALNAMGSAIPLLGGS